MAINTELSVYPDKVFTAQDFAVMADYMSAQPSCVLRGCVASYTTGSNILNISEGWVLIHGRLVKILADSSITVPTASSGTATKYLIVEVDLSNQQSPVNVYVNDTIPTDTQGFNYTSGQAYLNICTITVNTTEITNADSLAPYAGTSCKFPDYENPSSAITKNDLPYTVPVDGILIITQLWASREGFGTGIMINGYLVANIAQLYLGGLSFPVKKGDIITSYEPGNLTSFWANVLPYRT